MWTKEPGYLEPLVKMKAFKSSYVDVNPRLMMPQLGSPWTKWFSLSVLSFFICKMGVVVLPFSKRGINGGVTHGKPFGQYLDHPQSHLSTPLGPSSMSPAQMTLEDSKKTSCPQGYSFE